MSCGGFLIAIDFVEDVLVRVVVVVEDVEANISLFFARVYVVIFGYLLKFSGELGDNVDKHKCSYHVFLPNYSALTTLKNSISSPEGP